MIKINIIVWDEWNIEHIKKHNVSQPDVEELCTGNYKQQPTYNDRFLILGKIKNGRALTVILARVKPGEYYIVTARDMSKKERRQFL